jgi:hypothetical protein
VYGLRYGADVHKLELETISAGRTALLLMDNAVAARVAPARVLPVVRAAVRDAAGFIGVRGAAPRAAAALLADCL